MIDPRIVLAVLCLYIGALFGIALWVERRSARGRSPANHPLVYSLSLGVYCTAWTYYGSVGKAATSGMLFLPIYLGPTLAIFLWWTVLRKLVQLKTTHRITSIADFISARYRKSQPLAALATLIASVGIIPYIALQLKAIITTFAIITTPYPSSVAAVMTPPSPITQHIGPVVVALMAIFTIILGVRRLDPTERHEGMVTALAVECLVKLVAFLTAGVFVTYFMFDGFGDIFKRLAESPFADLGGFWGRDASPYFTWASYLVLSIAAIQFLPRQFHVTVVENPDEKYLLTAMWSFPLYMLLINIFVLPIAVGGLLKGYPIQEADSFVLRLPLSQMTPWLTVLVFIGGFSAAAGMIMVSSVTAATMITNHLLLPLVARVPRLSWMKRHLLRCRWGAVIGFIVMGYWGEAYVFKAQMLVNIGLISFAAVLQFAPVVLGGIFWRRANQAGALLGLGSGFLVWCYTQMVPSFVKNGWLPLSILEHGPGGVELLKPEALFGLTGLDPISHTFLWSMLFNVGGYVLGSLYFTTSEKERSLAEEFAGALVNVTPPRPGQQREAYIDADPKVKEIENLLFEYFSPLEASAIVERCLQSVGIRDQNRISIVQLVELHSEVERMLAGSIGAAAAHQAVRQGTWFTSRESTELAEVYAEILADLKVTPDELKRKIDYQLEREHLLIQQARELQTKVTELEREIIERRRAQEALRESEERYRGLVETMNEGLAIEDPEGLITYVNDRLCRMWGCTREEIIGRRVADFLGEAERDHWSKQATCRTEVDRASSGATWTCKDGRKISAIVSSVPLFTADGQYQGSFAVVTDISHLKTIEREKANMISMFAHDMRSSLTGIHGLGLRLLTKSESIDEAKRSDYLRIINKEASKLESLVDDFLEFSRLETGRLKLTFGATSLDKELMELYETYQHRAAQKGLKLELHMEEALPIIYADEKRLRRVFTNLLDNAVKFSKAEGTITLVAQETTREALVQIIDEGVGMAAEELPYIFDLFHRGRSGDKRDGYGIGLATVKAIVEGHGGRIQVASEVGQGSTFSVFLPKERKDLEPRG